MSERSRYPGYDVLAKRETPSWDDPTRRAIDKRLHVPTAPRFLTAAEWAVADALCRRILPQGEESETVPLGALLDAKLFADHGDGFREADMPYMREAWRAGLAALDAEAKARHDGRSFAAISFEHQDSLVSMMQKGALAAAHWHAIEPKKFFERRVLVDIPALYYSHPKAWSEIGFGGPASPRGYVRLEGERRDPWEAAEAVAGHEDAARQLNQRVV
jgi:hypothetical protein